MKHPDGKISAHFTWAEMACKCCDTVPGIEVMQNTAAFLEKVRAILDQPMSVHCVYRCPKHNAEVGGVPNSEHVKGWACDFSVKGMTAKQVQAKLKPHLGALIGGLGRYPGFTHVDRRTNGPATWTG